MFDDVLEIIYEIKIFKDNKIIKRHYCVKDSNFSIIKICNEYLVKYHNKYPDNIISVYTYDNDKNTGVYSINSLDDL